MRQLSKDGPVARNGAGRRLQFCWRQQQYVLINLRLQMLAGAVLICSPERSNINIPEIMDLWRPQPIWKTVPATTSTTVPEDTRDKKDGSKTSAPWQQPLGSVAAPWQLPLGSVAGRTNSFYCSSVQILTWNSGSRVGQQEGGRCIIYLDPPPEWDWGGS